MKAGWEVKPLNTVASLSKKKGGSRPLPYVGLEDIALGGTGKFFGSYEPQSDKSTTFEFGSEMRGFLVGVLQAYAAHGESELSLAKLSSFLTARYGTLADAKAKLGSTGAIKAAFVDIQRELYSV